MEGRQLRSKGSNKVVLRDVENADRISNLPAQVHDLILSRLPIRDTVRTSILSKSWRHKWAQVPVLAFNAYSCSASSESPHSCSGKALASVVNHVLMLHTGDLDVFKFEGLVDDTSIDRWIRYVSRKSVKVFVLHVYGSVHYKLPSSLFDCSSLVELNLGECYLKPLSTVHLERLKLLCLVEVSFTEDTFETFISSCPSLERLSLSTFQSFDNLRIKAPNLRYVILDVQFRSITFGCTLVKVSDFIINLLAEPHSNGVNGPSVLGRSGLSEFFTDLPNIKRLRVSGFLFKYLASSPIPESMPFQFKDLYHLEMSIDFVSEKDCSAALCILNSSPNLTALEINATNSSHTDPADSRKWWDESRCRQKFEKLRSVEVDYLFGIKAELNFMGFMLANSPMLGKMRIRPVPRVHTDQGFQADSSKFNHDFLVDTLKLKRASPQALVIIDYWWMKK